jgi:hypothetical protein
VDQNKILCSGALVSDCIHATNEVVDVLLHICGSLHDGVDVAGMKHIVLERVLVPAFRLAVMEIAT